MLAEAENAELPKPTYEGLLVNTIRCTNPACITQTEQELDQVFRLANPEMGICRCVYCENKELLERKVK